MDINRFFVGLFLVSGLIEVHAQSDDEDSSEEFADRIALRSKYRRLDESALALNPATEDYSSAEDAIAEFMKKMGVRKMPHPSTTPMPDEDYNWHVEEGKKVLKRLSQQTGKQRANRNWLQQQLQARQRNARIAAIVKARNDAHRKNVSIILQERVRLRNENGPRPSRD